MRIGSIYVLIDPLTFEIRYVGQTIQNPKTRFSHHKKMRNNLDWYVYRWWRSLPSDPILRVIDEVDTADLNDAESEWIQFFRSIGCKLTNLTDGGGQTPVSAETRRKMSLAHKGKSLSAEHKSAISRSKIGNTYCLGKSHTEEAKKKISIQSSLNGRRRSPLSENDIEVILKRYATGRVTLKTLGDEYNVAFQTISKIVNGQHWKNLKL